MPTLKELLFLPPLAKTQALFLAYKYGQILSVNKKACELYGYTEAEFLQMNSRDLVNRDPQFEQLIARIHTGEVAYGAMTARRKDGSLFKVLVDSRTIQKNNSLPVFVVKVCPFEELEPEYRQMAEHLPEPGNWEVDFSNSRIELDEQLQRIAGGVTASHFSLREGVKMVEDPLMKNRVKKLSQESAVFGKIWSLEFQIRLSLSQRHWVLCHCVPVFRSGSCVGLRGSIQVIDVFKHVEGLYADQNAQLQIFFDNTDQLVTVRDRQMKLLYSNDNMRRMFGYDEAEFSRMTIRDLVYSEDQDRTMAVLKEVREKGRYAQFHNRVITKSGEMKEIIWNFIWFAESERLYAVGKDVTDEKVAKRMIEGKAFRSEEEEKHALFEELHENICQTFAAAKIYVSTFLNQGGPENLVKANELMTSGIETTRALAAVHLFPDLKMQSFVEALRMYYMELNKAGRTAFTLDTRSFRGRDLPYQVKSMLYRSVQEITTRIIQHAKASKASLKLVLKSSNLKMEFRHNGKLEEESCPQEGIAYGQLQSRLDQLGGSMIVSPDPERGCRIIIELDLLKFEGFASKRRQSVAEDLPGAE